MSRRPAVSLSSSGPSVVVVVFFCVLNVAVVVLVDWLCLSSFFSLISVVVNIVANIVVNSDASWVIMDNKPLVIVYSSWFYCFCSCCKKTHCLLRRCWPRIAEVGRTQCDVAV